MKQSNFECYIQNNKTTIFNVQRLQVFNCSRVAKNEREASSYRRQVSQNVSCNATMLLQVSRNISCNIIIQQAGKNNVNMHRHHQHTRLQCTNRRNNSRAEHFTSHRQAHSQMLITNILPRSFSIQHVTKHLEDKSANNLTR